LHGPPISDKVRERLEGTFNKLGQAFPLVAEPLRRKLRLHGFLVVQAQALACGCLTLPLPEMLMRKIHLMLVVLLSGICLACQPDPSQSHVERVLAASWQSY
jgi:hypothetical protein